MMMGPSAPKGPPDPMEIAEEIGFRSATFGSTRLPLIRIASMASGNAVPAQMVSDRRNHGRVPAAEIEKVREEADQSQQGQGHKSTDGSDDQRQKGNGQDAQGGGEIAQLFMAARAGMPGFTA